jgi:hypothetical protein
MSRPESLDSWEQSPAVPADWKPAGDRYAYRRVPLWNRESVARQERPGNDKGRSTNDERNPNAERPGRTGIGPSIWGLSFRHSFVIGRSAFLTVLKAPHGLVGSYRRIEVLAEEIIAGKVARRSGKH